MRESKTITIQLSPEDSDRLEAESKRLELSPETLAMRILQTNLAHTEKLIEPKDALEALNRLREIGKNQPPIDAVELARASREELEQRGTF